jgi:hypothetical protein
LGRLTRLVIAACLAVPSLCQAQSPIGLGYQAPPGDPDPGTKMVCALYSGSAHDQQSITSPTVALLFGQASPDTLVAVVFQPKWAFRIPKTLHGSIRLLPSGGGSADVQAYGNQAVLPLRLKSPADLAALKASLMQADTMSIRVDDAWHTHIKTSLAGIGPRLDGLITCAHQHDPRFPQSVPDPDRVRLGDWIGIKADDQGGRSCRVEATDGDRTLIIVNFLSGESAGRTGFSIRKRGWTFPDQADRTVTIQTARMDFMMAAHPSDDVLEGILGKAQALQLLRALDGSNRMTVQVSPHVSSWSLPIKGAARAAEFLDTCGHAPETDVQR